MAHLKTTSSKYTNKLKHSDILTLYDYDEETMQKLYPSDYLNTLFSVLSALWIKASCLINPSIATDLFIFETCFFSDTHGNYQNYNVSRLD